MTVSLVKKAARLITERRVQPLGIAAVYRVNGTHGFYHVVIGDQYRSCSCPARGTCSHLLAAEHALEELGERRAREYAAAVAS